MRLPFAVPQVTCLFVHAVGNVANNRIVCTLNISATPVCIPNYRLLRRRPASFRLLLGLDRPPLLAP